MSAPPARLAPRYPLLDTWRGLACVIVVLHHAGYLLNWSDATVGASISDLRWCVVTLFRRLDAGVPMFFVISGYCIAASMDAHRKRGASSWHFLGRRIWRIYPPYWAAVACFAVVVAGLRGVGWPPMFTGTHSLHLDGPDELSWPQWLGNLTLTETWRPRFLGGGPYKNLTRISWTLCFEEQFYLVGFLLLLAFPRRLFGALLGATGAIFAVSLAAHDAGWFYQLSGTFPEHWHEFAVGLVVYWRLVVAESDSSRRTVDLGLAALGALGAYRGNVAMAEVGFFGLILIGLRPFDATLNRWRALAPFRACGLRCYSIYLIHLPVCTVGTEAFVRLGFTNFWVKALAVAPLVSLAGVGAGWLFYALVESRFHNPSPARLAPSAPAAEPSPVGSRALADPLPPLGPGSGATVPRLDPLGAL